MLSGIPRLTGMARRVVEANVRRPNLPLKVNFALTYWCQYRCKTCNIWKLRPSNELTTDEVLAFAAQNRIAWLDLTGGEIFLRKDISEILEAFAASRSLAVLHFPTNGFLTDRIVASCERLAARRGPQVIVTVSVDGDETLNDDVRGIKGGFQRQMETFRQLRRLKRIKPVLGMTLSAHNAGAFEQTFDACRQACPGLEIEDFHLNVAQVSTHYYGNDGLPGVAPNRDAAVRELRLYRRMKGIPTGAAEWLEATYLRHLESFMKTGDAPMRCHSLRSSCFIDPWGTVFPCITYTRPLGSLRDHGMSLAAIWTSPATTALQREIWEGNCPTCWTACEAYQSILGNLVPRTTPGRPIRLGATSRS